MPGPGSSATSTVNDAGAPAAPAASEVVVRPEPGLARGAWEAPPWAFWAALAVIILGATLYLLVRLGIVRLPTSKRKES